MLIINDSFEFSRCKSNMFRAKDIRFLSHRLCFLLQITKKHKKRRIQNKSPCLTDSESAPYGLMLWLVVFLIAVVLVTGMGFCFHSWFWIPVVIIIGTIALVKVMPKWMLSIFIWVGGISAAMFVAHPIARKLFITVAWKQDIYDGLMLYIIATIALSWAVKQLIDRIPKPKL